MDSIPGHVEDRSTTILRRTLALMTCAGLFAGAVGHAENLIQNPCSRIA